MSKLNDPSLRGGCNAEPLATAPANLTSVVGLPAGGLFLGLMLLTFVVMIRLVSRRPAVSRRR